MTSLLEPLAPGSVLAGRYRVGCHLGQGARKRVHLAHDEWLGRDVAVCGLLSPSEEEAQRLRREAALLARLGNHPSVVAVHDLLEVDGSPLMICQHLPGGSLQDLLAAGRIDPARALAIAADLAAALSWAHRSGVVHRDVKPANVWLDGSGRAVLGDFGLAVGEGLQPEAFGLLVGTAPYVAPEQLVGDGSDLRSDLWSLGAVLYELLTGRPPHVGDGLLGLVAKVLQDDPPRPSLLRDGLPAGVDELVLRLLDRDPAARPPTAEALLRELVSLTAPVSAQSGSQRARAGFVGRATELGALRDALADAAAGRGGLTVVLGQPGVGKTRTALELAHGATTDGWTVLTGRCHEHDVAPAFWPWTQALQSAVRALPAEQRAALPATEHLAALVPELAVAGAPEPDPDASRFLLFRAVAALLTRLAESAPVLVLLDDVHWMDSASLALTRFLARELTTERVAVVACARDVTTEDDPAGGDVVARLLDAAAGSVPLGGLSREETSAFVTAQLQVPPDAWLLLELHERTDGNPFYVAELVRLLQAERRITPDGRLLPGGQLVPSSVREVLQQRLRHVSPACAQVLRTMSVVGREVRVDVLARVDDRSPESVLELLDEAVQARLVVHVPGGAEALRFAHALVREALYEELTTAHRADLHRRALTALADAHHHDLDGHAGALAHHAVRAAVDGDVAPAVVWSLRAARAAARQAAHESAVLHAGRAVELAAGADLPVTDELPPFRELLLVLGEAQHRLGQTGEARFTFLRAAEESLTSDDAERLARAALGYGLGLGGFGFVEHADGMLLSLLEEAAASLGDADSPLRVRVLARLATELHFTPFRSRRLELSAQALAMAHRLGDPACELVALYSRTLALLGPDALDETRRTADRVVWTATTLGDVDMAFRGHHLRLLVALEAGTLEQARAEVAACRHIADVHRQPLHAWHATTFEAMIAFATGRHEESLQRSHRALQAGRGGAAEMASVMHGAQLLAVHWASGRLDEVLDGARVYADNYPHAPAWRAALAFCCTEVGRLDLAQAELDVLAERDFVDLPEDGNYLTTAALAAHVAARVGDVKRAQQLEAKLRPYADRHIVVAAGALAFTSVRLALGVVRAAYGDLDGGVRDVEAAHALHLERGTPAYAVWSAEELARLLLQRAAPDDRPRAQEVLAAALPRARDLGMPAHVRRLEALLTCAGGGVPLGEAGCVTVLLSDVAGSTRLTEELGERAVHALLGEHRRAVETTSADEGGFVLKVLGDAVVAAFPSPDAALRCAARLQERYCSEARGPVRLRIGVHTGPVLRQGDSMYGRTMILAFRVSDQARAGEVLVTAATREALRGDVAFEAARTLHLKGISEPQTVWPVRLTTARSG